MTASLYIHVPFCTKKCDYCHFYVIPDQERFQRFYLEALKKEWELRGPLLPNLASLYFGGGTPSLLGPDKIATILSWIPSLPEEITLEANPEEITYEKMVAFKEAGISRVSIGVQSLNDPLLLKLGRTHTAAQALFAVEETFRAGMENISIDLMYDLPDQNLGEWEETLKGTLALPISHLSLYNLSIEPHTSFYKKRHLLAPTLPDEETSLHMLQMAVAALKDHGFRRYEISAFERGDYESRHNIGYWTGRPFLGLGPSACSYWEGSRFRNHSSLNRWAKLLESGEDPSDFRETLSPLESLKERLAVGLRMLSGVPREADWPLQIQETVYFLEQEGFLQDKKGSLSLTEKGILYHDTVAEHIMNFNLDRFPLGK